MEQDYQNDQNNVQVQRCEREDLAYQQGYEEGNNDQELKRLFLEQSFGLGHKALDTIAECRRVEAQADMVREWSKVEITKTVAKFKSCQEFMFRAFGERDQALKKDYSLLDKGIASGDKELILMALQNISSIVTKSPLEDLEQLARLYDDPSQPVVLDF